LKYVDLRGSFVKKKIDYKKLSNLANYFEIAFAVVILVIIVIRGIEIIALLFGAEIVILQMSFERILSMALTLIIGVEFTKMLIKHTPESVIDVLLFAIARQAVLYNDKTTDMLYCIVAIGALFAIKKFLVVKTVEKEES